MILIACHTPTLVENLALCLGLAPDTMYLLGESRQLHPCAARYREILRKRQLSTKIETLDIRDKDLEQVCNLLGFLVPNGENCVIDLTGGDDLVAMAVGAMLATVSPERRSHVSVQKFDAQLIRATDRDGDGRVITGPATPITVEELIALYGGIIHPGSYQPPLSCTPRDLDPLWELVRESPKTWNRSLSVLGEVESRSDSKTQVCISLSHLQNMGNFEEKEQTLRKLLEHFDRRGVIRDESSRNYLEYTYTSELLRHCTQKAGNVLEVKTLLEARALEKDGKPFFRDCRMGVNIDWDGIVHDPEERRPETRNEVDLVLTRGYTPLFVSCKNGNIGDEELYKLHTVATRFGGPHARKMLIATDLDRKSEAADKAFIQRAKDMGIYLVTDAAKLSKVDWQDIFPAAMGL